MVVSALVTLLGLPMMTNAMADLPEMGSVDQKLAKTVTSFLWWGLLAGGVIWGLLQCVVAHWIARFLNASQLWFFAAAGLAPSILGFFFSIGHHDTGGGPPLLWSPIVIVHGPATTCAYWLIANWLIARSRAA